RNYAAGDNIRHLDWRMLARTDRLYVKQYEEETNLRAQIVLDASRSMMYHSGESLTKFQYGSYSYCFTYKRSVRASMRQSRWRMLSPAA
ncbi:MAG: DUF58 domain-containing protein, partial [Pirellulaceae bacterium]